MIRRTTTRMALCVSLLTVNLLFIWGNSLMPGAVSEAFSNWMYRMLSLLLPGGGGQGHGLLRKLAHFTEFCTLGAVFAWLFAMLLKKQWAIVLPALACGCLTACADEMLQHFSPGRNPSLLDVGIDSVGVLSGIVLLWMGYNICKKTKNNNTTGGN